MLFRVWNKKNSCWSKEDLLLDRDGDLQEPCGVDGVSCCPVLDFENYEVEFNTGITLADGTETFFGDIIRWKTITYKDGKYEAIYVYSDLTKDNIFELEGHIDSKRSFFDYIELVGNIHEMRYENLGYRRMKHV